MASGVIQNSPVFATIEGTFGPDTATIYVPYPDGFAQGNTRMLSLEIYLNTFWRMGQGIANDSSAIRQTIVLLGSQNIGINNQNPELFNKPYRVTLMHY